MSIIILVRGPEDLLSLIIKERFQALGSYLTAENCSLIATGTNFNHSSAGHIMGEKIQPARFIATPELDLHPELLDIQPMGESQEEWFSKILLSKASLVWTETIRMSKVVKKICQDNQGQTVVVIVNNRIIDATSAILRSSNIDSMEGLASIKQEHLDKIAVKLVLNGGDSFKEESGITREDVKLRMAGPVETPRWPGEFNPSSF